MKDYDQISEIWAKFEGVQTISAPKFYLAKIKPSETPKSFSILFREEAIENGKAGFYNPQRGLPLGTIEVGFFPSRSALWPGFSWSRVSLLDERVIACDDMWESEEFCLWSNEVIGSKCEFIHVCAGVGCVCVCKINIKKFLRRCLFWSALMTRRT